jgi:hypothetical protein
VIDRLRYAVRQLVLAAHPSGVQCVWDPSTYPRSPTTGGSIVTAKIMRGPTRSQSQRVDRDVPTSMLCTIASPTANTRIGLRVSSVQRHTDLGAAPTTETARDALLGVLNEATIGPALLPGVTAAAVGADAIRLTGAIGTLYDASALGPGVTLATEASTYVQLSTGRANALIELQAYAQGRAPVALELLGEVDAALRGIDVDAIEEITGCTFARHTAGDIVDLTAMAGAEWESRAAVRLAVHLRSMRAVAIEQIEGVDMDRLRLSALGGSDVGPDAFAADDPS